MSIDRRDFLKTIGLGIALTQMPNIVEAATTKKVIILGLDGVGLASLNRVISKGGAPNIQNFILQNNICQVDLVTRSLTVPSWATWFTGLESFQHGCWGNASRAEIDWTQESITSYSSTNKMYGGVRWWTNPIPWEHTMFSFMPGQGIKIGWMVSKFFLSSVVEKSPFTEIMQQNATTYKLCRPEYYGDAYIDKFREYASNFLSRNVTNPFILFIHTDPDYYGHKYGETSPQYENEITRSDNLLGYLLATKTADTKVIILSDHGFDPETTTHNNAYDAFMTSSIPIYYTGATNRDLVPTLREYFGFTWKEYFRKGKSLLKI